MIGFARFVAIVLCGFGGPGCDKSGDASDLVTEPQLSVANGISGDSGREMVLIRLVPDGSMVALDIGPVRFRSQNRWDGESATSELSLQPFGNGGDVVFTMFKAGSYEAIVVPQSDHTEIRALDEVFYLKPFSVTHDGVTYSLRSHEVLVDLGEEPK